MSAQSATAETPTQPTKDNSALNTLKDEELLARFFRTSEEGAFSVLVARYGSLVYGVCKRVLGNATDAEDAFQATFLVLVKKGESLQQPGRLANWLYGVAMRTASHVKSKRAQRKRVEREAGAMPAKSEVSNMNYEQLWSVLDEEINQLPPKYALPLTLCYLEGKTSAEAATQLGWPEGSMSRRLARAKDLLRSRLTKRGMAMSAMLLAASMFARPASACAPPQLLAATVKAGTRVAEGARLTEVVSPYAAQAAAEVALSLSGGYKLVASLAAAAASLVVASSVVIWQVTTPDDESQIHPPVAGSAVTPLEGKMPGHFISISIDTRKEQRDELLGPHGVQEKSESSLGAQGNR